ncbi:MAG: aminotransferase class I/II-fold pyridoxal phosphate-dependent enzyme [Spirochaeta sp.]|nr:aminotransferase class I/II-fold pyridoxal phosphate-dependent enzyme [Spirochaeta sp.]
MQTTQVAISGDLIDLSIGHPSPSLLPLEIMKRAAEHRLNQGDPALLQYGFEQGDCYFRKALAVFLCEKYGISVDADHLFISNGVSQALDIICTLYTRPGDLIFVEEPTYFLALRIFADHHLRVESLPLDEQGLVVEALEERLAKERPAFLYTIPTHQNPTGATMSVKRRRCLVELSKEFGFMILADEVYHLLSYTGEPPPPFASFISGGSVFSLGSFSKILAPGLRLGWIHASPELLRPLALCGMLDSGGGLNPFTSALVRSVLESGLQIEHLERLRVVYRERLVAMRTVLRSELPGLLRFNEPRGGFFFWIALPEGVHAPDLLPEAQECRVNFMPGSRFSSSGGMGNYLRLSFSYYDAQVLKEGVRRLAKVLQRQLQ